MTVAEKRTPREEKLSNSHRSQMDSQVMSKPLNFLSQLTGCFSTPCAENPTVAMVEAAYRHHALDARYINCDVSAENLGDAVRGARAMGWLGFNLSIPHKVAVIAYLDEVAESAAVIGAVNCVVNRAGRLIGENTDGKGFIASLRTVVDLKGKRIVLLGAGGAARAIAVEATMAGVSAITIVNRSRSRGEALVALVNDKTQAHAELVVASGPYRVPEETEILVNATSIGLFPDVDAKPDLDWQSLRSGVIVADVIPNPPRSALLRAAAARGCRTLDGLGMLVNQAVIGIALWTGVDVDPAVMRRKLEDLFA
jgi:shikimate dehydrogenase